MMSFGGWGLETSHRSRRVRARVKLASKMALHKYFTRERMTYATKVPSLSDKQVEKNKRRNEACARRGYLWPRQVQRIYGRRKSTDWKVRRWTWQRKSSLEHGRRRYPFGLLLQRMGPCYRFLAYMRILHHTWCPCPLVNVMFSNTAFYTQLGLHIFALSIPRSNVRTGRSVRVTYTSLGDYR